VTVLADTGHVEAVDMPSFAPVIEALAEYVATPPITVAAPPVKPVTSVG